MPVTKPAPLLACPDDGPPACLSLGSRPRPPWGYSSVLCAPSQPWNVGHPTALSLHPISLYQHLFGDFTVRSVAQSCPTLSDPMNHSMPGRPVHHQLPEFTQIHVHPAISSSVVLFSSCPQALPASGSFPMSQLFT